MYINPLNMVYTLNKNNNYISIKNNLTKTCDNIFKYFFNIL